MKISLKNLFRKPDKWIAVDVELDGMHPSRVIQLSYLVIEGRRVRGKNMYFATKAVNRYAKKVHGLSVYQLKKLSGGDVFACRADEIYNDFKDCKLVIGHDVAGDMKYLKAEFARIGVKLPDIPIKEIAFSSGFNSESSFCSTFRKWEHMTPGEYRECADVPRK